MRGLKKINKGPLTGKNRTYLDTYFQLMALNGSVRVLEVTRELKILKPFKTGPKTAKEVSSVLKYSYKPIKIVLEALASLNLLEKKGELFVPSPVLSLLVGDYENLGNDYWDHLPELIKTGKPLLTIEKPKEIENQYAKQVKSLDWMMSPSAHEAVKLLRVGERRKNLKILDVGAGSGVWSLAVVSRDPSSHTTLLDLKKIIDIAKKNVDDKKLRSQVSYIKGDFFKVNLPKKFNFVIVANVLHIQSKRKNINLLKRLKKALSPEGEILIIDILPKDEEVRLPRLLYEIGLMLRTKDGQVYEQGEIISMLTKAGFSSVETIYIDQVPPYLMGMIMARPK